MAQVTREYSAYTSSFVVEVEDQRMGVGDGACDHAMFWPKRLSVFRENLGLPRPLGHTQLFSEAAPGVKP
jgi:hypothetical protein